MPAPTQVFLYFVTVQLRSTLMPIGVNVATLLGGLGTIILATGYYQQLCYCSSPNCAFDTKMAQMSQTPQIGTHDDKKMSTGGDRYHEKHAAAKGAQVQH